MVWMLMAAAIAADPSPAIVRVELLAPRNRSLLASQQWARTLAEHDVPVTVRPARPGEETGVSEKARGRLRFVTAVGTLDADGDVRLPGKRLSLDDTGAIARWIDGLKTYGAAGTPDAAAGWGLTGAGWVDLCARAARPARALAANPTAGEVVAMLGEVTALDVQTADLPDARLAAACDAPVTDLSVGTAAAVALHAAGIGFVPRRQPDGSTVWVVGELSDDSWPTGWVVPTTVSPVTAVGPAFKRSPLPDAATLGGLIDGLAKATGVPHVPLTAELVAANDQWQSIPVTPPRQGVPVMVLLKTIRPQRLARDYRWDDSGRGFLLIRAFDAGRVNTPEPVRPPGVLAAEAGR